MKLSTAGRAGILVAVLLAGCSRSDETGPTNPAPPAPSAPSALSAPLATAGSPVSESSTPVAGESESVGVATTGGPPVSEPAPSSPAPAAEVPSVADPAPQPSSAAAPGPAANPPAPNGPTPNAPAQNVPAATFPDPAEVEAQGLATNPLCEVFSVDEVTALAGAAVAPAVDAADGTACLWSGAASGSTYLQLQVLGDPARYLQPAGAEGVSGIGDAAFVVRSEGGWTAQAQNPDGTFAVQIAGSTATRDAAIEGLRRLLERY